MPALVTHEELNTGRAANEKRVRMCITLSPAMDQIIRDLAWEQRAKVSRFVEDAIAKGLGLDDNNP